MPNTVSREIRVPFSVGQDGGIAYTEDPVIQAIQHIMSAAVTNPAERCMRPAYGVPVYTMLFEANDPLVRADLRSTMELALQKWVPEVELVDISMEGSDTAQGVVEFMVSFRLVGSPIIRTAAISVGGQVTENTIPRGRE